MAGQFADLLLNFGHQLSVVQKPASLYLERYRLLFIDDLVNLLTGTYESGWKIGSITASTYLFTAPWAIRSETVGMPRMRSFPLSFGMRFSRTGGGK
jgi:hypothetical protein